MIFYFACAVLDSIARSAFSEAMQSGRVLKVDLEHVDQTLSASCYPGPGVEDRFRNRFAGRLNIMSMSLWRDWIMVRLLDDDHLNPIDRTYRPRSASSVRGAW